MNLSDFKYVECGADRPGGYFLRNRTMKVDEVDRFRAQYDNTGVYATAYRSNDPSYRKGYQGDLYGDLYFDFDDEANYQYVKEDAIQVLNYLYENYGIEKDIPNIYFSGSKGIHITISAEYFGIEPHKNLNQIFRAIVKDIRETLPERKRFNAKKNQEELYKTLDIKIYDNIRMFRLVNSIHQKSHCYKIQITPEELETLDKKQLQELAKTPREVFNKPVPEPNHITKSVFETYRKFSEEKVERVKGVYSNLKLDEAPPCIQYIRDNGACVGNRNVTATILASYFKQAGLGYDETLANVLEWNEKVLEEPSEERELTATVGSVYAGSWNYGCTSIKDYTDGCDKDKCPFVKKEEKDGEEPVLPPKETVDSETMMEAQEEIKILFPGRPCFEHEVEMLGIINKVEKFNQARGLIGGLDFGDEDLNEAFCGLQPALYVLAGPPNIGKSMLALQIGWNVIKNNPSVYNIYFAIDDPDIAIMPRLISIDQQIAINAAKIPKKYANQPETLRRRELGLIGLKKTIDRFKMLDKKYGYDVEHIINVANKHRDCLKRVEDQTGQKKELCLFIDNLYDVRTTKRGYSDPNSILQYVSEQLDTYAETKHVPIFCTGEMKKVNATRRPILDDLKDTIELQYDASAVMICYNEVHVKGERAEVYHECRDTKGENIRGPILEVHVAKNKLGEFKGRLFYKLYPGYSHMDPVRGELAKHFISLMQN